MCGVNRLAQLDKHIKNEEGVSDVGDGQHYVSAAGGVGTCKLFTRLLLAHRLLIDNINHYPVRSIPVRYMKKKRR